MLELKSVMADFPCSVQLVWVMLAMVAVLIAEEMREIVLWWQYHSTRGTDRLGLARNLLYRLYDHNVHMKAVGWLTLQWYRDLPHARHHHRRTGEGQKR